MNSSKWNLLDIPTSIIPNDPRFGSGPSVIQQKYITKMAHAVPHLIGTSHRKKPILNLVKEVQEGMRTYFKVPADYEVILGNGGATFLWDMMGLGLVQEASLHYTCGEFSQKWYLAHKKIPWIKTQEINVPYGQGIDPIHLEGFDVLCTTLNETSTGVQNTAIPPQSPSALMLVDATSGAGQIMCELDHTDLYYFSPQKVLGGDGGLFFGFISPRAKERALKLAKDQKRYIPEIMNWNLCVENSEKNQSYNTPSIMNLFVINEQLKEMNLLGQSEIVAQAKKKAELIYNWAESKEYLSPFVQHKKYRSQAVATIDVKDQFPVEPIINFLREKQWVYDIDPYRKLGKNQFRISLFHNITLENLEKLTQLLSFLIEA